MKANKDNVIQFLINLICFKTAIYKLLLTFFLFFVFAEVLQSYITDLYSENKVINIDEIHFYLF